MLNKKEIKEKKKYIINRLKCSISDYEEKKLRYTLSVLMELELRSDNLKNIRLYNLTGVLFGNYTFIKDNKKLSSIVKPLGTPFITVLDREYLEFILKLAYNTSKVIVNHSNDEFIYEEVEDEDVEETVRNFYNEIGNNDIKEKANKILDDPTHYGFTDTVSLYKSGSYGVTAYDLVFEKPYISVMRTESLMEYQAFSHEVMHGIDFYILPTVPNDNYYGFDEVPSYASDYLFIDYLEERGFNPKQVDLLRRKKLGYVVDTAHYILDRLDLRLFDGEKIRLDWRLVRDLLEFESCIIAKGLYEQIKENKEEGLANLVKFMSNPLIREKTPDFSFIKLPNEELLKISNNMGLNNKKINILNN